MTRQIDLELISGTHIRLMLPPSDGQPSCYVFSMKHSGQAQFWELVTQLLQGGGRAPYNVPAALGSKGAILDQLAHASIRDLLCREGYGFGLLFGADPTFDLIASDSPKLLFLRDPRDMLVAMHRSSRLSPVGNGPKASDDPPSTAPSLEEFLQCPMAERAIHHYQRFVEHWRSKPNVTLLRYEYAVCGWHAIAAEVAAALQLSIDPQTLVSIAASTPALGDQLPLHEHLDFKSVAALERRLTGVLAPLGYAAREWMPIGASSVASRAASVPDPNIASKHNRGTAVSEPVQAVAPAKPAAPAQPGTVDALARSANLRNLYAPDPSNLGRLKPNATAEMHILGRRVIMDVDPSGWRPVVGQPAEADEMFWVYGCSLTYGIAVPAEETFCSLLQSRFPMLRIENHGIPGFSTTRNLLHLERDVRYSNPEIVTFCWIEHHLKRNVAAYDWIETLSKNEPPTPGAASRRQFARAALDADGALQIKSIRIPRHDLIGLDLSEFGADSYYLDLVCLRLLERAHALVSGYGGHFFVTILKGHMSATLQAWLTERTIPVVDASLNGNEYICWPDDWHPNTLAHGIYAERIGDYVERRLGMTSASLVA